MWCRRGDDDLFNSRYWFWASRSERRPFRHLQRISRPSDVYATTRCTLRAGRREYFPMPKINSKTIRSAHVTPCLLKTIEISSEHPSCHIYRCHISRELSKAACTPAPSSDQTYFPSYGMSSGTVLWYRNLARDRARTIFLLLELLFSSLVISFGHVGSILGELDSFTEFGMVFSGGTGIKRHIELEFNVSSNFPPLTANVSLRTTWFFFLPSASDTVSPSFRNSSVHAETCLFNNGTGISSCSYYCDAVTII